MTPPADRVAWAVRGLGLVALGALALAPRAPGPIPVDPAWVAVGIAAVSGWTWLALTGAFGAASATRRDLVALVPFAVALLVRVGLVRPGLQEIVPAFAVGPVGRHSVVQPLLELAWFPFVRDPVGTTYAVGAVLGAAATLGAFQLVRHRTGDRRAAFVAALLLATHPVVARYAPTDGPYGPMLAAWFAGLALLADPAVGARGLLGGTTLLALAAATRLEGALYVAASLLTLDLRALGQALRRHPRAATAGGLLSAAVLATQGIVYRAYHAGNPIPDALLRPAPDALLRDALLDPPGGGPALGLLLGLGVAAGLRGPGRGLALGLLAAIGLSVAPVVGSAGGLTTLHRLVPAAALQALLAGLGAAWLGAWARRPAWAVAPGVLAAALLLAACRDALVEPTVVDVEVELARAHLGPGGDASGCTLLVMTRNPWGDVDVSGIGAALPGVSVRECRADGCADVATAPGCAVWLRSAVCAYRDEGAPEACAATGATADGDRAACLEPACAALERSLALAPLELRTVRPLDTFPDRAGRYPVEAEIGLFRVTGAATP